MSLEYKVLGQDGAAQLIASDFYLALNHANNATTHAGSTDGVTWNEVTLPSTGDYKAWKSSAFGGAKFVAISGSNSNVAAYSLNGTDWTTSLLPETSYWNTVTYGTDKFVALGAYSNNSSYSTDGVTWALASLTSRNWKSVTYGSDKFVAVASYSSYGAYSTDGLSWSQMTLPFYNGFNGITHGEGKFVVAPGYKNSTAYSTD
jgi:hypothetical protein